MRKYKRIREEFTLHDATIFGGYNLLRDYFESIKLFNLLDTNISIRKGPTCVFQLAEVLGYLIEGYCLGLERIYHFSGIEADPLMTAKNGIEKLPDYTLYQKDLRRIKDERIINDLKKINHELLKKELSKSHIVLDFDSTVETVYGNLEGSDVGYNAKKHGRPSYHPQLCFIRESGLLLDFVLRAGTEHTRKGIEKLFDKVFPYFDLKKQQVICCLDSGYDDENVYKAIESAGISYVGKLRMFSSVQVFATKLKYKKIDWEGKQDAQIAAGYYQCDTWSKKRKIIVLRYKPMDDDPQGVLFDEFGYTYFAYVTKLC